MLHSTSGVVFHTVPYSDNRVIAKIYTREFGLLSFIVSVSRSKSGKIKSPLLQPLTQVELQIDKKEKSHLHSVRDISLGAPYTNIHGDIVKTTIALFVAEVLYKSIREEEKNDALYTYLSNALQALDISHESIANFHLVFMMNLTRYLGFYPSAHEVSNGTSSMVFDLMNGTYLLGAPSHFNYLDPEETRLFNLVSHETFETMHNLQLTGEKRKRILNSLIRYFEFHIPGMQKIQGHELLAAVLSGGTT